MIRQLVSTAMLASPRGRQRPRLSRASRVGQGHRALEVTRFARVLLATMLSMSLPLHAQSAEVPRARTFSGLVSPPFPYTQPENVGLSSETLDHLGDEITSWIAAGELVGAELLIVKDDKAVLHEAYGWSDRERQIPVERNSIWWIGGASKPFTATAALMLVEEGRLSLDDPVSRFIPELRDEERTTIRHLLTHTSGFGDRSGVEEEDFPSLAAWVTDWAIEGPSRAFGEFYNSDFSFQALGHIIGVVSGTPVDRFLTEHILEPLGLTDTSPGFSSDPAWRTRLNPWYRWNERAGEYDLASGSDRPPWRFYSEGLFSTAMDVAQFVGTWMDERERNGVRLLSETTVEEALEVHARDDLLYGYGYGWYLNRSAESVGPPWNFHHWGTVGVQAIAFPADDAIVVYMTHSRWGPHHDAFWNRLGMSGLFDGNPGPDMVWADGAQVAEGHLSAPEGARYVGTYVAEELEDDAFEILRIWQDGGLLHLGVGASGVAADHRFHLVPLGEHRFAWGRYAGDRLRGVDPAFGLRFIVENEDVIAAEVLEGERVGVSARRIR